MSKNAREVLDEIRKAADTVETLVAAVPKGMFGAEFAPVPALVYAIDKCIDLVVDAVDAEFPATPAAADPTAETKPGLIAQAVALLKPKPAKTAPAAETPKPEDMTAAAGMSEPMDHICNGCGLPECHPTCPTNPAPAAKPEGS